MKEIKLGNGLRLTESDDMGIFIHYESISGNQTGMFMGNTDETPGHRWATELLNEQDNKDKLSLLFKRIECHPGYTADEILGHLKDIKKLAKDIKYSTTRQDN